MARKHGVPILRGKNAEWLMAVFDAIGEGEFDIYVVQKIIFDEFREKITAPVLRRWNSDQWIELVRVPDKPPKAHIYKIRDAIADTIRAKREGRKIIKQVGMMEPFKRERTSSRWLPPWEKY